MDINHSNVNPILKVYPTKFVQVLCIVMVMIFFLVDSHNALTHILQGYFAGTGQSYDCPSVSEVTLKDAS